MAEVTKMPLPAAPEAPNTPRDARLTRDGVEVASAPVAVDEARVGAAVGAGRDGEDGRLPADAGREGGAVPHRAAEGGAAPARGHFDDTRVVDLDAARAVPNAIAARDRRAANFLRQHGFNFGEALRFGLLGARVPPLAYAGPDEEAAHVARPGERSNTTLHDGGSYMETTKTATVQDDLVRVAIGEWVRANGTDSQRARLAENLLPEKEALASIRADLFRPTEALGLRLYRFWEPGEVCINPENEHGAVAFATEKLTKGLTAEQFEKLGVLRGVFKFESYGAKPRPNGVEPPTVELRVHFGACTRGDCKRSAVTALVTFDFYGRPLSREFIL